MKSKDGLRCTILILCLLTGAPTALSEPLPYSVDKVRKVAQAAPANFVLLSAHRGYWRDVPENSLPSIQAAIDKGYESVEIDVRLSRDGTAWLSHDNTLERATDGIGFLSDAADGYLKKLRLKDRHGHVTGESLMTVRAPFEKLASDLWNDNGVLRGYVLIVDCKSAVKEDPHNSEVSGYEALKASWEALKSVAQATSQPKLGSAVIFKLKAKDLPDDPAELERDLGIDAQNSQHFYLEVVLQPDDIPKAPQVFKAYNTADLRNRYVIGFEPNAVYIGQPNSWDWVMQLKQAGLTVPGFPSWNEFPEGVTRSSGLCCVDRNTDPKSEKPDYVGSWEFHLQIGSNWLTTDRPDLMDSYLRQLGMRNTNVLE